MRIDLRDEDRRRIGRIEADPALRPTRVTVLTPRDDSPREVFLDWETAVDDAGRLRRCVACGCTDLFREKVFPQITGLVVVLAFAGAVVGLTGAVTPPMLGIMSLVLALDIAILLFSRQRLVCYRCRSSYRGLALARYHRTWDRALAERYPARVEATAPAPPPPPAADPRTSGLTATPRAAGEGSIA